MCFSLSNDLFHHSRGTGMSPLKISCQICSLLRPQFVTSRIARIVEMNCCSLLFFSIFKLSVGDSLSTTPKGGRSCGWTGLPVKTERAKLCLIYRGENGEVFIHRSSGKANVPMTPTRTQGTVVSSDVLD
jgi:hypothetical protein